MSTEGFSEYEGGGLMPNTVFPKGSEALTSHDKLRLQSLTGQDEDSKAPLDPGFWYGNENFDVTKPLHTYKEQEQRARKIQREERTRYVESPPSYGSY